jgi:hypothetical protein
MPRFTGEQARWESFRRWLAERLVALDRDKFIIIEPPDGGYVQFINEGPGLLGECSDPRVYETLAPHADDLDENIRAAGWGPIDPATGSPNYRAKWYPEPSSAGEELDRSDALDAASLTVKTMRRVFRVEDPGVLDISGDKGEKPHVGAASDTFNESDAYDPPHTFASDVDGTRHVLVVADAANMDGWSVATSGGTRTFDLETVWGAEHPNFLGHGEPTKAWVAICDHGDELLNFLPPAPTDAADTSGAVSAGTTEGSRLVYLRSEQAGGNSRYLTARRVASGDLWIEGQDLGAATLPVSSDGEHEWLWVVPAADLHELLRVLGAKPDTDVLDQLAENWSGAASYELERRLRESGLARLRVI